MNKDKYIGAWCPTCGWKGPQKDEESAKAAHFEHCDKEGYVCGGIVEITEWKRCPGNSALYEYYIRTKKTRIDSPHTWHKCTCGKVECQFCDGGLGYCTTCGGVEGTLTTDCCGYRADEYVLDAVYKGGLDFIDGEWIVYEPACENCLWAKYGRQDWCIPLQPGKKYCSIYRLRKRDKEASKCDQPDTNKVAKKSEGQG